LIPPLAQRKLAQGKSERQRLIAVESKREQLVLETERSFAVNAQLARRPETAEKGPEKVPEKFR